LRRSVLGRNILTLGTQIIIEIGAITYPNIMLILNPTDEVRSKSRYMISSKTQI